MDHFRFTDQKFRLEVFQDEVWVHCSKCDHLAIVRKCKESKQVRISCTSCGFLKYSLTEFLNTEGNKVEIVLASHLYFNPIPKLWFSKDFKGNTFWAYNPAHLDYLRQYISAKLREKKDRNHFTLIEKLPKFYHEARNRGDLLKLIDSFKLK